MKNTIILIVGHTGAGKSYLIDILNKDLSISSVCVSDLGKLLSARKNENKIEVEKLIYQRIVSVSSNRKYTLIDGLASFDVLEKLIKVFNVKICYLNIDYQERIFRISKRQNINVDSAIALEKEIETNKEKSGLSKIIQLSNLVICDNSDDEVDVLRRWIYEK